MSANIAFSAFRDPTLDQLHFILDHAGMDSEFIMRDTEDIELSITSMRDIILNASGFNVTRWEEIMHAHPPHGWLGFMMEHVDTPSHVVTNVLTGLVQEAGDLLEPIPGWNGWPCLSENNDDESDTADHTQILAPDASTGVSGGDSFEL